MVEVVVVSKTGIPESAIVSIRAGPVKRQAPATSDKPFRFAKGETKDNLLKFDILQVVGTGYAVLKPFEDRYNVSLKDGEMSCEVDIKHVGEGGASPAAAAAKQPDAAKPTSTFSVQNAQTYLDDHGVLQFIQGMIQALVKERPADPYKYMGRQILNGYDVGAKPEADGFLPGRAQSGARVVHDQAQRTLEKLLTPLAGEGAPGTCLKQPEVVELQKCAPPPAEDMDAEPAFDADTMEGLKKKAKGLLVQGFQTGSLEASLTDSNDQKNVEELRQKAKGLFVQGFYSGNLEATLVKMHGEEEAATAAEEAKEGALAQAEKPAEDAKQLDVPAESAKDSPDLLRTQDFAATKDFADPTHEEKPDLLPSQDFVATKDFAVTEEEAPAAEAGN